MKILLDNRPALLDEVIVEPIWPRTLVTGQGLDNIINLFLSGRAFKLVQKILGL